MVVTTYMGLRSGEKLKGAVGGQPSGAIGQAVTAAGGLLERVKGLLRR